MAMICPECDWLNSDYETEASTDLHCQRCGHTLYRCARHRASRLQALTYSALLMLAVALSFPFLGFATQGTPHYMTLTDTVTTLVSHHFMTLGIMIGVLLLVLPFLYLGLVAYLTFAIQYHRTLPGIRMAARTLASIAPWLMLDVFLVGILVALVKLHSIAKLELGLSFWAYCAATLLIARIWSLMDMPWLWDQLLGPVAAPHKTHAGTARQQSLCSCECCSAIQLMQTTHCQRCGHPVHSRRPHHLSITIALLLAASIMYIPANVFPIMDTTFLGQTQSSTIVGGIIQLWRGGSYPIAIIILVASILVPLAKIFVLAWLCWQHHSQYALTAQQKQRFYQVTEFVGRWSMIDIFVVAVLTALVQQGNIMNVIPGPAILSFAAVVVLTMLAAMAFDPRQLWDALPQQETHP